TDETPGPAISRFVPPSDPDRRGPQDHDQTIARRGTTTSRSWMVTPFAVCMPPAVGRVPLPVPPSSCATSECPDRVPLSTVLLGEIWDMLLHAGKTESCGTRAIWLQRDGVPSDLARERIGG